MFFIKSQLNLECLVHKTIVREHCCLSIEAKGTKDSEIKGTADHLPPEFTDAVDSQTLIPSSTQQTAVDNGQNAPRPVPELIPRDCLAGDYERLAEELLKQYCMRQDKPKCAQIDKRMLFLCDLANFLLCYR